MDPVIVAQLTTPRLLTEANLGVLYRIYILGWYLLIISMS